MEGRPWAEWRNGKPITAASLARQLTPFGISPGTRRDRSDTFKGYLLAEFEEAFNPLSWGINRHNITTQ